MIFRALDLFLAALGLVLFSPLLLVLLIIGFFDTGSPVFSQKRLGKDQKVFTLFKFRSMVVGTPSVATHLSNAECVTLFGGFLRKSKLDELPQLWNVLIGDMSFVGPRPGLVNHLELTEAREGCGVFKVRPGITGLSQIMKIDMSTPELLAFTDAEMIRSLSMAGYFKYILLTLTGKGGGDTVR